MKIKKAFDLVNKMLSTEIIHPTSYGESARSFPEQSVYYGRHAGNIIQIRVSDHETKFPKTWVTSIILYDGIMKKEVLSSVNKAIADLTEMEDQLARSRGED